MKIHYIFVGIILVVHPHRTVPDTHNKYYLIKSTILPKKKYDFALSFNTQIK